MKLTLPLIILGCIAFNTNAQKVRFGNNDDYIKVKKGDDIFINADSAYLVSALRAQSLNNKLSELDEIKELYSDLAQNRKMLLNEVNKAHALLTKLTSHMKGDSVMVNENLSILIGELDASLSDFKDNNRLLKKNNGELSLKISQLQRLVKSLRKETKGLWWNGVTDKIVAFTGGAVVGALLIVIL